MPIFNQSKIKIAELNIRVRYSIRKGYSVVQKLSMRQKLLADIHILTIEQIYCL
jgi:hypothetical protein